MYGLPKVHKQDTPLRPILSAINTFNYAIAKFFVPILEPLTHNEYTVRDTFSFVREVTELQVSQNCTMVSFDVKSLFTCIPLSETINLCVNNMFANKNIVNNLNKQNFTDLLKSAVVDSIFLFNKSYFKQLDGVAMGSPLGPTLANAFLSYHECVWLDECPLSFKPIFYRRYVDDTFIIFKDPSHADLFLNYLNGKHANIEFTCDKENNGSLSFLDVLVSRQADGSFETNVYRKPTFTGLTMKFSSFLPMQYKRNLTQILTFRSYKICSTFKKLHQDLVKLKNILISNGFPSKFIDTHIGKTLNKFYNTKPIVSEAKRDVIYFSVPFLGRHSISIRNQLLKLLKPSFPQITFKIGFSSKNNIGAWFNIKDRVPTDLRSLVIYQYKCDICMESYIGKTKRHLKTRIHEHQGLSVRTGKRLLCPMQSQIREHFLDNDHPIKRDNFKIIGAGRHDLDLLILESLHINKSKPKINLDSSSTELFCF